MCGRMRCKVELCDPVTIRQFMDPDYLVRGRAGKDSERDQVFDVTAPTLD